MKSNLMAQRTKVSIVPNGSSFLNNQLFSLDSLSGSHAGNGHWMYPFKALRIEALKENIQMDTCDILCPKDADIVIFMELPSSPTDITILKNQAPHLKIIFMPIETPLGRRYIFNKDNHEQFDAILTYNHLLKGESRYFHFHLPVADLSFRRLGRTFSTRKPACMISSNSYLKLKSGLNVSRSGWRFSIHDRLDYIFNFGALAFEKRRLVRAFERYSDGALEVYGQGWDDHPKGLIGKLLVRNTFASVKGVLESNKLEALGSYKFNICYENCESDCGYLSEKIFDALYGDTVPVYLGNRSIEKYIPKECFVDARKFRDHMELVDFICNCTEGEWLRYRKAGQEFLQSTLMQKFLPSSFIKDVLAPIRKFIKERKYVVDDYNIPLSR